MLINIYSNMLDDAENKIVGRTKLFVEECDEEGSIINSTSGTSFSPLTTGTLFIVDDWLIDQLDKVIFKDGTLSIKDGEELIPPVKSEKQLKMEELQRQMAELQAMSDEPVITEEPTGNEQLLLDDPENNTDIKSNE